MSAVGYLAYDDTARVSFDDVVLAHLEIVIISKFRRKESFALSWREPTSDGSGRSTIWLDSSIALRFRFDDPRPATINRDWLNLLADSANSGHGLIALDENGEMCVGSSHASRL